MAHELFVVLGAARGFAPEGRAGSPPPMPRRPLADTTTREARDAQCPRAGPTPQPP